MVVAVVLFLCYFRAAAAAPAAAAASSFRSGFIKVSQKHAIPRTVFISWSRLDSLGLVLVWLSLERIKV